MLDAAGFADDGRRGDVLAGGRHHDDEVRSVDLVDQILGAAGEVVEPAAHRERLAAAGRAGEGGSREEAGALPRRLRQLLDDALALGVERDHLDGARLRIRPIDAEFGLRRRAHPRRFALHVANLLMPSLDIAYRRGYFIMRGVGYKAPR